MKKTNEFKERIFKYFNQPLIIALAIMSLISFVFVVIQQIIYQDKNTKNILFVLSGFSNLICFISFSMFYNKAKKRKSLKAPALLFYWYHLIMTTVIVILFIISIMILIINNSLSIEILKLLLFLALVFIGVYLAQLAFSKAIKKSIYENKKIESWLKAAQIINYICAIVMLGQIYYSINNYIDIIVVFSTSLCYAFKGISIREFKKIGHSEVKRRNKWKTLQT